MTKKDTSYVDLFRYATDETLQKIWKERMKEEYDNYPSVKYYCNIINLIFITLNTFYAKQGEYISNIYLRQTKVFLSIF